MSGLKKTGALTVFTPPYGVVCQCCVIEAVLSGQYCSTLRATFWVTLGEQGMGHSRECCPQRKSQLPISLHIGPLVVVIFTSPVSREKRPISWTAQDR
jgi:hypothetical protein